MQEVGFMTDERSEAELWTLLGAAEGSERAGLLLELADRKLEQRDVAAAVSMLETAAGLAGDVGDEGLAGRALEQLGGVQYNHREHEASARAYGAAADHYRNAGWDDRLVSSLWGQADALSRLGLWEEMLRVSDNGLAIADSDENAVGLASLSMQRARALYRLDREEEALAETGRARDTFRRVGLPSGVADADEFAHGVCMYLGRLDEALELATNCYVLAGSTRSDHDEAEGELRLAETHIARTEPEDALVFADKARGWFKEQDDSIGVARAARLRGRALSQLDRDREALDAFVEARVMFDANGWDYDARDCELLRAIHLHALGRFGDAESVNARLAVDFKQEGLAVGEAWSVARRLDNLAAAEGQWLRMREVAQQWWDTTDSEDATLRSARLRILALWAYALWMSGESDEAFRLSSEALDQMSDDEFDRLTALIFEVRGRCLMSSDDPAGRQELAHAVALHLAHGSVERARELSQVFLPELREESREKDGTGRPHGWS